jgi:hypothetical protein
MEEMLLFAMAEIYGPIEKLHGSTLVKIIKLRLGTIYETVKFREWALRMLTSGVEPIFPWMHDLEEHRKNDTTALSGADAQEASEQPDSVGSSSSINGDDSDPSAPRPPARREFQQGPFLEDDVRSSPEFENWPPSAQAVILKLQDEGLLNTTLGTRFVKYLALATNNIETQYLQRTFSRVWQLLGMVEHMVGDPKGEALKLKFKDDPNAAACLSSEQDQ